MDHLQSLTLRYSSLMVFSFLSLVSKTKKQLKTKEPMHQAVKKMKRAPGLPSRMSYVMIGNRIITSDALIQFEAVEYGTIFGCTISGMQSHTTGPRERPKTAMNMKRPARMSPSPEELSLSPFTKNPIITSPQAIPSKSAPYKRICLLPNLVRRQEVTKVASTCSKFISEGISSASSPLVASPAILPPYMATPLMPENCCMTAKWIAMMMVTVELEVDDSEFQERTVSILTSFFTWLVLMKSPFFSSRISYTYSSLQMTAINSLAYFSCPTESRYLGVSQGKMKRRATVCMAMVISGNPKMMYQKSLQVSSPVAFLRMQVKMQPVNTPRQMLSWAQEPRVPEISLGESSLMMRGAMELQKPTQNPWQSLKMTRVGKVCMQMSAPTVKAKAFIMSRHFLLENLAMKKELLRAPMSAPMGMHPLRMPSVVPMEMSMLNRSWRVSVLIWPRQTMQQPKQKEERQMFHTMSEMVSLDLQVTPSKRGFLAQLDMICRFYSKINISNNPHPNPQTPPFNSKYHSVTGGRVTLSLPASPSTLLYCYNFIKNNSQMNKESSRALLQSEHTFSNPSFKSSSNNMEGGEGGMSSGCSFCQIKPYILRQVERLKQAVIAKNEQIKELEAVIQKISKMAFTSSTDVEDHQPHYSTLGNSKWGNPQCDLTFAQPQPSPSPPQHSKVKSFAQSAKSDSKYSLEESQVSQNQLIKSQIKKEVKKLNMEKPQRILKEANHELPKESLLRTKLMSIMSLLPQGQSDSQLHSFQTQSEPMAEGIVGLVNSKASLNNEMKPFGFKKKGESSAEQSLRSTYKSEMLRGLQ